MREGEGVGREVRGGLGGDVTSLIGEEMDGWMDDLCSRKD